MANRASGRADRADGADPFPWVVSLGCLAVGVAVFLHSTVPALEEQRELDSRARTLAAELVDSRGEIVDLKRRASRVGRDPEALLVEFDRLHMTPQQALDEVARQLEAERAVAADLEAGDLEGGAGEPADGAAAGRDRTTGGAR